MSDLIADNPYRLAMLAWAEELEAAGAPMGPLLAEEVRTRVARVERMLSVAPKAERMLSEHPPHHIDGAMG